MPGEEVERELVLLAVVKQGGGPVGKASGGSRAADFVGGRRGGFGNGSGGVVVKS